MPSSRRSLTETTTPSTLALDTLPADEEEIVVPEPQWDSSDSSESYEPSQDELIAAWKAQQRQTKRAAAAAPAVKAKEPDPYEPDDSVTLLLPSVYRAVMEGRESKGHRVFIGAEQPGPINEDTGRPERSVAVTLTFQGGVCRDVPYSVVKSLKKSRVYRSNDALKVIPNDTPESTYAKLCGVQPMQPGKQAAMLLASDLDAVLAEFDTEQLKVFSAALARRVQVKQQESQRSGILSSQSFQRG